MQTLTRKRYIVYCPWGDRGQGSCKIVERDFFDSTNGFKEPEIRDIARMKIDQVYCVSTTPSLKVWRIE